MRSFSVPMPTCGKPAAMTALGQPPGGKFDRAVHRFAAQGGPGHQEQIVIRTGNGRGSSLLGEARAKGYRIRQVVSTRSDILEAIETGYPDKALARYSTTVSGTRLAVRVTAPAPGRAAEGTAASSLARRTDDEVFESTATPPPEASDAAPIVDLVDLVINSAVTSRASDRCLTLCFPCLIETARLLWPCSN